jgi:Zn finger protein HypA/HybF involved in hydrogenase expression
MGTPRKYTKEEFKEAVETSLSIAQALRKVGLVPIGGNYATAHKLIEELEIDTSHMTGQGWNKGDVLGICGWNKRTLEEIMVQKSTYTNTHRLKERMIESGLKKRKCECCGIKRWNGQRISLELNHINGDRLDHRLENLQLLCPNCHAQTTSYRGKNKRRA